MFRSLEFLNFEFVWDLGIGIWDLLSLRLYEDDVVYDLKRTYVDRVGGWA